MVKQIKSDDFQNQVERPRRQKTVRITQNSRVEMARDFQIFQRPGRQLRQKSIFFSGPALPPTHYKISEHVQKWSKKSNF